VSTEAVPSTEVLLAERRGPVLLLTLNRPDRLNAWSAELEDRYFDALEQAGADDHVRAIVVTGAGKGFCAGADMEDLAQIGSADPSRLQRPRPRHFPLSLRKPLIAAINGPAAGLGLVQALYCDLRFCVPGAKLTTAFARRGLIAEYGLAWILPRMVGPGRALDLLMSGRVVLGSEGHAIGLVERLAEPATVVEEAVAYATELAELSSPTSMAIMKGQVHRALESSFQDAYAESERLMLESFGRDDVREGVASYLERRAPEFPPLRSPA
jgi:enoyl-CoA hydratase/carnithine racemase